MFVHVKQYFQVSEKRRPAMKLSHCPQLNQAAEQESRGHLKTRNVNSKRKTGNKHHFSYLSIRLSHLSIRQCINSVHKLRQIDNHQWWENKQTCKYYKYHTYKAADVFGFLNRRWRRCINSTTCCYSDFHCPRRGLQFLSVYGARCMVAFVLVAPDCHWLLQLAKGNGAIPP